MAPLALATTFSLADRAEAEPGRLIGQRAAPEGDISVWAMGTEGDNLGALADDFMEEFPDVSVDVTAVPWDAAHDQHRHRHRRRRGPRRQPHRHDVDG